MTGNFIKVSEQRKTFVPNVASAGDIKSQIQLISLWLPIGMAVLGAILLVLGSWMASTGRKAARGRHEEITDESDVSEDEDGKVTA